MKITKANYTKSNKTHRSTYGKYSCRTNTNTKVIHGVEVPESSSKWTEPYMYRSALYFNDRSGVQTKQLGVVLQNLRKEYNISRRAFAELATSFSAQYGIELKPFNIESYERAYYWRDKFTGKMHRRNACSPKIDKLTAVVLGCQALTGMTFEQAFMYMTGYTNVIARELKEGA